MKAFLILLGLVPFLSLAETFSLNADWRFAKAAKPIPLAQAKAIVETAGVTDVVAALYERKPLI